MSNRKPYPLHNVEQGDLVRVAYPNEIHFNALVTRKPEGRDVECIDRHGLQMVVPAPLIVGHVQRGHRERRAA